MIPLNPNTFVQPVINQHPCAQRDYTVIIDASGSMVEKNSLGQTRWNEAKETTLALAAKVFEFDPDGLDLWVFSSMNKCYPNVRPEKVRQIFEENEPFGGTNMADVLDKALRNYFDKRDAGKTKPNGEMILIVTDGEPDNQQAVINTLFNAAMRLRPSDNLAINFIQIGNDPSATNFLKGLDVNLVTTYKFPYDFVTTITPEKIAQQGLTPTILNLINETAQSKIASKFN